MSRPPLCRAHAPGWWPSLLALLVSVSPSVAAAQGQDVVRCEKCHGDPALVAAISGASPGAQRLYVTDSIIRDSKHQGFTCATCHPGFDEGFPHRAPAKFLPCQTCHMPAGEEWASSIHAVNTQGDSPTCTSCHGSHAVYGADDRRSPTYPLNVAELCGKCHADPRIIGTYFAAPEKAQARTAVQQYFQTVHGMALTRNGLVVSATCNDCHGAHAILPADSSAATVNRFHVAETCGSCHAGILQVYEESAHGEALRTGARTPGGEQAPVCVDCHSAHGIVRADQPAWFIGVVEECGTCHERLYETYFETYHGKVTRLGFGLTAKCSDCHTAHDMRPVSDSRSSVFPANLVTTCSTCHPRANENFVKYYSHGDPRQRTRYPALFWSWIGMSTLLAGVMTFFGIHTVLWLTRVGIDRIRGRRPSHEAGEEGPSAGKGSP